MALDEQQRAQTRRVWELGDYPAVGERLLPGAQAVAAAAGPGRGLPALDVATGTGSLALALAGAGWQVSAVDISPRLLAVAVAGSREHDGPAIGWHEASMDDLPFEVGRFELVASSFGLIFAADPEGVLAEVRRVLRPEGRLVFSAWTPEGFIGAMTSRIGDLLDVRDTMMGPFRWGEPQVVSPWLSQGFTRVHQEVHAVPWGFPSASAASAFFFERSPGHLAALEMAGDRAEEVVHEITAWLDTQASEGGSVDLSAEYLVTTARRG